MRLPSVVNRGVSALWSVRRGPDNTELVASWMFCGDQPHAIAFTKGQNGKLHHFAYRMPDWSSLLHAGDVMSMHDVPIDFGPARHGITRGETIYFFDPSGNRNEVFSGGYRTGKEWRTITWTMDQAARGINYHDAGTGEPVLLIHGSGPRVTAWANWRLTMPDLSQRFRVIAPDVPGFGYTERNDSASYDMDGWTSHLVAFLEALDLQRVHIVGNSLGGALALSIATRHPELVDRLVLMGSAGVPFELTAGLDAVWGFEPSLENMRELLNVFAYDRSLLSEELAKSRLEAATRPGAQEAFSAMFPEPRQDCVDALTLDEQVIAGIDRPVLVIHGRDDQVIPLGNSLRLLELIEQSQLHVFGRCVHGCRSSTQPPSTASSGTSWRSTRDGRAAGPLTSKRLGGRPAVAASVVRCEAAGVGQAPPQRDLGDRGAPVDQVEVRPLDADLAEVLERRLPDVLPKPLLDPAHADPGELGHLCRRPGSSRVVLDRVDDATDDAGPGAVSVVALLGRDGQQESGDQRATQLREQSGISGDARAAVSDVDHRRPQQRQPLPAIVVPEVDLRLEGLGPPGEDPLVFTGQEVCVDPEPEQPARGFQPGQPRRCVRRAHGRLSDGGLDRA